MSIVTIGVPEKLYIVKNTLSNPCTDINCLTIMTRKFASDSFSVNLLPFKGRGSNLIGTACLPYIRSQTCALNRLSGRAIIKLNFFDVSCLLNRWQFLLNPLQVCLRSLCPGRTWLVQDPKVPRQTSRSFPKLQLLSPAV